MELRSLSQFQTYRKQAASIERGEQEPRSNCRQPNPSVQPQTALLCSGGYEIFLKVFSLSSQINKQMKMTNDLG